MPYDIVTVTVNPSLDKITSFNGLVSEQKIRCEQPHYDAGGGGINVSKAIARLGGESLAIFASGGSSGERLEDLLANEKISIKAVRLKSPTRENLIALDRETNKQYRFGFPGEPAVKNEIQSLISEIDSQTADYLVLSGSLSPGMNSSFYADIVEKSNSKGIKCIVDTSGEALREVLKVGAYLIKPNIGEFAKLSGTAKLSTHEAAEAAKDLIHKKGAEIITVSLGAHGAMLVTKTETFRVSAPPVNKASTVGAGDSMVGGMVWALSQNKSLKEVIRWGVACGTAATMNEGTQLFKRQDAFRLFKQIKG